MLFYFIGLAMGLHLGKYSEQQKNYYFNYVTEREKVQVLENKLITMNRDCTIKQTTNTNETNTNETNINEINTNETYYKDDT